MRYFTIPGQPGPILWRSVDGSGVIYRDRPKDADAWAAYESWCEAGNVAGPEGAERHAQTIEAARAQATARMHRAADTALAPILSQYPDSEAISWPVQLTEAQAWLADATEVTPLLDALAAGRDKATLCHSIIAKADAYKVASGRVFGWRHACSEWIAACEDAAALDAWTPHFPDIPGDA